MRCSICDFEEHGLCSNFEVDWRLEDGRKNKVYWHPKKQSAICGKCTEAHTALRVSYFIKDAQDENSAYPGFNDYQPEAVFAAVVD